MLVIWGGQNQRAFWHPLGWRVAPFSAQSSRYSPLALRIRETPAWAIAARRRVLAAWTFSHCSTSFCAFAPSSGQAGRLIERQPQTHLILFLKSKDYMCVLPLQSTPAPEVRPKRRLARRRGRNGAALRESALYRPTGTRWGTGRILQV